MSTAYRPWSLGAGNARDGSRYRRSRQPGTPGQAGERGQNPAPERQKGGAPRTIRYSEMSANLFYSLRSNRRDFSECTLMDNANQVDFDSAIPRFESSRPSQPVRSLWAMSGLQKYVRHSRELARSHVLNA